MENSLARLLHGDARSRFEPSGVICEFDFPLASLWRSSELKPLQVSGCPVGPSEGRWGVNQPLRPHKSVLCPTAALAQSESEKVNRVVMGAGGVRYASHRYEFEHRGK